MIPIYALTGFLGSGKTTLLSRILAHYRENGMKPAVVMNELGDINLDGIAVGDHIPMEEILGGCICCSVKGNLGLALNALVEREQPDVIIIESTGAANPLGMIDAITEVSLYQKVELKEVITVIDALALSEVMEKGVGKTWRLMKEQIRCGSILLLNKTDMVTNTILHKVESKIREWNASAVLERTVRGNLSMEKLLLRQASYDHSPHQANPAASDNDSSPEGHAKPIHPSHDHVMAYTHYFDQPIDSEAFETWIKALPAEVYRPKACCDLRIPQACTYFSMLIGKLNSFPSGRSRSFHLLQYLLESIFQRKQ